MKQKINKLTAYLIQITRREKPEDINVKEFPEPLRGLAEGIRNTWEYAESLELRLEKLENNGFLEREEKRHDGLLEKLIEILADWIVIMDEGEKEPLFKNREYFFPQFKTGQLEECLLEKLSAYDYDEMGPVWDMEGIMEKDFRVESFCVAASEEQSKLFAHRLRDITAEKRYVNRLEQSVYYDPETRLYNRRFCNETLEKWLKEKQNFSVCFVDLDHLKYVNDTFGHKEGDRYIASVVEGLRKSFRESDYICRVGGDEMVILLHECSEEMARKRCQAAQERVEAIEREENRYPMGFSFGVTVVNQPCASQKEDVLSRADQNMYTNKTIRHKELDKKWKEYRKSNFF